MTTLSDLVRAAERDTARIGADRSTSTMSATMSATTVTAVDTFARRHEADVLPATGWYRERMPTSLPGPGQQFAFEVDLDACTGCKACVSACHSLNGLDEDELWRNVGTLHSVRLGEAPEQKTVTTACHHCADPACLAGCPVNAYEKDPVFGAVVHLDDQCIGCGYCTMTCPYEVPSYSSRLGIVRKCDMCHGRLAAGEAPACVEGCPNAAIRITTVDTELIRAQTTQGRLVPGAAPSSISAPTTRYVTRLGDLASQGMRPTDAAADSESEAHHPLVVMLVLTQLACGLFVADAFARLVGASAPASATTFLASTLTALGSLASLAHLGRPTKAYRVVLGVGHSWLSREAVILSALTMLSVLFCGAITVGLVDAAGLFQTVMPIVLAITAVIAVATSVMVYASTQRAWWSLPRTSVRFGSTVAIGAFVIGGAFFGHSWLVALGAATAVATAVTGALDLRTPIVGSSLGRTRRLLLGRLRTLTVVATALVMIAAAISLLTAIASPSAVAAAVLHSFVALLLVFAALAERSLFFRAVAPDRMPGWRP